MNKNRFFTVVYEVPDDWRPGDEIMRNPMMTAVSWSHAMHDRDAALARAGSEAPTGQQAEPMAGPHDDALLSRAYLKAINHTAGLRAVYDLAAPTAAQKEGTTEQDAKDAARWREALKHVGGTYCDGGARFTLRYLSPIADADIMKGSVAGHFTAAIDAAIAAQPKEATDTRRDA